MWEKIINVEEISQQAMCGRTLGFEDRLDKDEEKGKKGEGNSESISLATRVQGKCSN